MILYFLLDIMVYNYTPFSSFFLITNIKENSLLELFLTCIFFYFISRNILVIFLLLFLYMLNKYISVNTNLFRYHLLINFVNYFFFLFFLCILYKKNITIFFLQSILINLVFWICSYIFSYKGIYTTR